MDECGICGGSGIPEGECDCDGNVVDECGICGGSGIPEGECDCDGNVVDECGICGGTGIPEGECDCDGNVADECGICGGTGIPEGDCDCNGNQIDALGNCGGGCEADENNDGVCDTEILGCTSELACNYNPSATFDDGSCAANDECGICGGDGIPVGACDCNGNQSSPWRMWRSLSADADAFVTTLTLCGRARHLRRVQWPGRDL